MFLYIFYIYIFLIVYICYIYKLYHFILLQIASGKIGIHFPTNNIYLFRADNNLKDKPIKDILPISKNHNKSIKESNKMNYYHTGITVCSQILTKTAENNFKTCFYIFS